MATRRQAVVVSIENADKAFTQLADRIKAIEQERLIDPTSPRIAVATAKRFLSSDQYRIDFHDLVMRELKEVRRKTSLEVMPLGTPEPSVQSYTARVEQIAAACSILAPVVATGVMWGNGQCDDLWKRCITLLARSEFRSGTSYRAWSTLQYLPAAFVAYSACAAGLISRRFDIFKTVFQDAQTLEGSNEARPSIRNIGVERVFYRDAAQWLHGPDSRLKTPGSDWMVKKLESMLIDVFPPDVQFEELWDEIELIASLIFSDVDGWAMPGRFMWRKEGWRGGNSLVQNIKRELDELGEDANKYPLLTAGLFQRDVSRLQDALQNVTKMASQLSF